MHTTKLIRIVLYAAALFWLSFVSWTIRRSSEVFSDTKQHEGYHHHGITWRMHHATAQLDKHETDNLMHENKEAHVELTQKLEQLEEQLFSLQQQQQQSQQQQSDEETNEETLISTLVENNKKKDYHPNHNSNNNKPSADPVLPSCRTLMQYPHSPWANGDFLTQQSHPVWTPRHDGSQVLDEIAHICRLHRYTADEARQCLAHSVGHLNFIGDSISRYQFLSLAQFVHTGHYPAHFPRAGETSCRRLDDNGVPHCAPPDQPNLAMHGDWTIRMETEGWMDSWQWYHAAIGGGTDGGIFEGHMECNCARRLLMQCREPLKNNMCATENELYVSPPIRSSNGTEQRFILSNVQENGGAYRPSPIKGFYFTGCAFTGSCRRSYNVTQELVQRAEQNDFDFSQPLTAALYENGVLRQHLPPANISIYNRGLWGALPRENSAKILPRLYNFTGREHGRCFYRSTTASPQEGAENIHTIENGYVRQDTFDAGCSFLDFARITQPFGHLKFQDQPLLRNKAQGGERQLSNDQERRSIYWDAFHFQPWVYEELNNLLLNVLCNHIIGSASTVEA